MEAKTKKKATAVAIATAVVLILAGTMAYLADASGTIRNIWDGEHIRVQINETGITDGTKNIDNGDKDYTVLPGTTDSKDPTITVDTDTDAYVFAVVKDTINSHGAQIVDYTIADGWVELDKTGFTEKEIKKYVDILNNKTEGDLVVDPTDPNTKIYYRIVHGTESADHSGATHRFTFPVLTNNEISYPSSLTNEDMNTLAAITDPERKALIFQTYAVQMEPWCPESEVAGAVATTDAQKGYAKNAWNAAVIRVTGVSVLPTTLNMKVGDADQTLTATVAPANATNKKVTWSSSKESVATVDENGVVHAVGAGNATITVKTDDKGKTATCEVTVTAAALGHIKWQVQLAPGYTPNATNVEFWPAAGNTYGEQSHTGDCICKCTWEEIVDGTHDFSNCHCTKTVTIDETKNTSIFTQNLTTDQTSGMLYDSLQPAARVWGTPGATSSDNPTPTYGTTLTAMRNAWDITGVEVSDFDLLTLDAVDPNHDLTGAPIVYNESGIADFWWLATPFDYGNACIVIINGYISYGVVDGGDVGIAPGFSISAN